MILILDYLDKENLELEIKNLKDELEWKEMIEQLKNEDLKSKIHTFIDSRDRTTLTDIIDNFNLDAEEVIKIMNELEEEGLIKQI